MLATLIVLSLSVFLVGRMVRGLSSELRTICYVAYAAHVLSIFAQVWITRDYYNHGDMLVYHNHGMRLANAMRADPLGVIPEVLGLLLHREPHLPFRVFGQGGSTGAMSGFAGLVSFVVGDSMHAMCSVFAITTFTAKMAAFRGFAANFPHSVHRRLLLALLMIPSVVFWTSGIVKEGVAVAGLGWMVLAASRLRREFTVPSVIILVSGAAVVAMVKSYILFGFVSAFAIWLYWDRTMYAGGTRRIRLSQFVLATLLGVGGVVIVGRVFPEYSVNEFAEQAAYLQQVGARLEGGSNYEIGNAGERGLAGQLASAPLALFTALFRPIIFEVKNALMLVSALETTALSLFAANALARVGPRRLLARVRRSPTLMFCVVNVLILGTGIGLSTTNLGTLSRYRVPMMLFFVVLVFVATTSVEEEPVRKRPTRRRKNPTLRRGVSGGRGLPRPGAEVSRAE